MDSLLDQWKKECYLLSSSLSIRQTLDRNSVERTYEILLSYFSNEYFKPNIMIKGKTASNWLHHLLVNHKKRACIYAVIEVGDLILYSQKLRKSIQKKLYSCINDPRQFRDLLFEVYMFRLLELNGIECEPKPKEEKDLDIFCTINNKKYLCECRKTYSPGYTILEISIYTMEKLILRLEELKLQVGLIGTIRFNNLGTKKNKNNFDIALNTFISEHNISIFNQVEYLDSRNEIIFKVVNYTIANVLVIESKPENYHVLFKIIPPETIIPDVPNKFNVLLQTGLFVNEKKTTAKIKSNIKDKSEQHQSSITKDKIYFIELENSPGVDLPIFNTETLFTEVNIGNYLECLNEQEIVCFIQRDYMGYDPKVSIRAYGKTIDPLVKERLENLKTDFF